MRAIAFSTRSRLKPPAPNEAKIPCLPNTITNSSEAMPPAIAPVM